MAGSLNKVMLIGNLGRDPEVHRTQDDKPIVNMSIATSERWTDKVTGEKRERTEWHRVVIFNEALCGIAQNYLKKGSPVYIEGQLQTRKWTDNQGVEKYTTEVVLQRFGGQLVLLGGNGNSGLNDPNAMAQHTQGQPYTPSAGASAASTAAPEAQAAGAAPASPDDDIPFDGAPAGA